jgi:hypothetical protein
VKKEICVASRQFKSLGDTQTPRADRRRKKLETITKVDTLEHIPYEKLDGRAVSALGVRPRKLIPVSTASLRMGDQNLLSRAPPCFGRHVKLLVPAVFAVVSTHSSFKDG